MSSATIQQWNLTSKSLYKTFSGHTSYVFTVAIYDQFLFSGSADNYWIQWHIDTGLIIKKVNTGSQVNKVVVQYPYLYTAGNSILMKYRVFDYNFNTTTSNFSITSTVEVERASQVKISSASYFEIQSSTTSQLETTSTTPLPLLFSRKTVQQVFTAKPARSSFTARPQQNFTIFILIGELIAAFLFLLALCFLAYHFILKRKILKSESQSTTKDTTSSTSTMTWEASSTGPTSTSSYKTSGSVTSSNLSKSSLKTTQFGSNTTTLMTQNVYSIPGYLQLKSEFIRLLRQIAKGGQGTVHIAEMLQSDLIQKYQAKQVIVKSIGKNFDRLSEREMNSFNQELAIISFFISKKGFVALYGYLLEPAALVLKFYPLGNMENLINRKAHFQQLVTSKSFILSFLREFSKAVSLLHDAGFVHCDIKPQNILLEADQQGNLHPVLTDFGITQIVSDKVLKVKAMTVENLRGFSLCYGAPEQILQLRDKLRRPMQPEVIRKRDIYAMAGLIYGLIMRKEPWHT